MKVRFLVELCLLFCLSRQLFSQSVTFSGNVYGFLGDKVLLLRKASKNVSFEGPISGVRISMRSTSFQSSVYTGITGAYSVIVPKKGEYVIEVSKDGYSSIQFILKYEDAGQKTMFPVTSFILKKDDQSMNDIGELLVKEHGTLTFNFNTATQKQASVDVMLSNKVLMEKAEMINNSSKQDVGKQFVSVTPAISSKDSKSEASTVYRTILKNDSAATRLGKSIQSTIYTIVKDSSARIEDLKNQIEQSKKELALIDPSSDNYQLLVAQITNAEHQLQAKEALIETQKKEIGNFKKMLTFLVLFAICAISALVMLMVFLREKKKHNKVLDEKNKEITKINARLLSSIRYASIIQTSFFKEKNSLQKLFPKAFIYNQPKDMLSGDFYWFGYKNGHKIIAVADCTGHGVPGALLTMLGHTILEEIVVVQGQVLPSNILLELNKAIMAAFSNQQQIEYGIDITVASIKDGANELLFSGITNGPYIYSNGKLAHHQVTAKTIGIAINEQDLKDQSVSIKQGDCVYLMSDGYCDQFGKRTDKIEKYNLNRMESLLAKVSEASNFSATDDVLGKEFTNWKGDREQTDDVLVVGFKI
jgi:serine phosphatase RsbU (regulator of sigma subunit)